MPDTWMPVDEDPRFAVPTPSGERETVLQYLRHYRTTFAMKCEGLDAEQMARRSVPPSTMSMLGLLRHLARVEHHWFRRWIEGRIDLPRIFWSEQEPDLDFDGAVPDDDVVAAAWAAWRAEVDHAEEVTARLESFDDLVGPQDGRGEVRDVLVHLWRSTRGTAATPTCCASASTAGDRRLDAAVRDHQAHVGRPQQARRATTTRMSRDSAGFALVCRVGGP